MVDLKEGPVAGLVRGGESSTANECSQPGQEPDVIAVQLLVPGANTARGKETIFAAVSAIE